MRMLVEIVVLVNGIGGMGGWLARRWVRQRRSSNVSHVAGLERENAQLDDAIARISTQSSALPKGGN